MLTDTELASMRTAAAASLPETATLLSRTDTVDSRGGRGQELVEAATDVPARRSPAGFTDEERVAASRIRDAAAWTITLPAGTRLAATDVVRIGGVDHEITAALSERSWEILARYMAKVVG